MSSLGVVRRWRVDRRTVVGALLAALAALLVLAATRPQPTVPILVAAQDLSPGVPLDRGAVSIRHVSSADGLVEGDAIGELEGWSLATPVAEGEPLLPSLLRPPAVQTNPDLFALSVDEIHAVLGRLATGDLVDIYVTWPGNGVEPGTTELLAAGVYVVEARRAGGSLGESAAVELLLAVDDDLALRLAGAVHRGELDLVRVNR